MILILISGNTEKSNKARNECYNKYTKKIIKIKIKIIYRLMYLTKLIFDSTTLPI